jgi:hypothetical protein
MLNPTIKTEEKKNPVTSSRLGTANLPACSIAPQPTSLLRATLSRLVELMDWKRLWKGAVMAEVLSPHSPEGTEENHGKP